MSWVRQEKGNDMVKKTNYSASTETAKEIAALEKKIVRYAMKERSARTYEEGHTWRQAMRHACADLIKARRRK